MQPLIKTVPAPLAEGEHPGHWPEGVTQLPSPGAARLPQAYAAARAAIEAAVRVDECWTWSCKMEALLSYARQMDDDDLLKMAMRIKLRAFRRCGELLKEFRSPGARSDQPRGDAPPRSQIEAGAGAGMSEWQVKDAVRVASVDDEAFDEAVEGDDPPTVTALAGQGKKAKPPLPPGFDPNPPEGYCEATYFIGRLRDLFVYCQKHEPELIANGTRPWETAEIDAQSRFLDAWLSRYFKAINAREEAQAS